MNWELYKDLFIVLFIIIFLGIFHTNFKAGRIFFAFFKTVYESVIASSIVSLVFTVGISLYQMNIDKSNKSYVAETVNQVGQESVQESEEEFDWEELSQNVLKDSEGVDYFYFKEVVDSELLTEEEIQFLLEYESKYYDSGYGPMLDFIEDERKTAIINALYSIQQIKQSIYTDDRYSEETRELIAMDFEKQNEEHYQEQDEEYYYSEDLLNDAQQEAEDKVIKKAAKKLIKKAIK